MIFQTSLRTESLLLQYIGPQKYKTIIEFRVHFGISDGPFQGAPQRMVYITYRVYRKPHPNTDSLAVTKGL